MGLLSDLTIQDLRTATLLQIKTAITNKVNSMTKKQLLILILKVADLDVENMEILDKEICQDGADGQILKIVVVKDVLDNKIKTHKIQWYYYPTGEVDLIVLEEFDALDALVSVRKIKHYLDGKQPHILV